MNEEKASPELAKFFENLAELKKQIRKKFEETDNADIEFVLNRLHEIFKTKEEQAND